jgi:hypothetical protein
MSCCQRGELLRPAVENWISDDEQGIDPPAHKRRKGCIDLGFAACVLELET